MLDGQNVEILSTPGIGLTVVCKACKPNRELYSNQFEATFMAISQIVTYHAITEHK